MSSGKSGLQPGVRQVDAAGRRWFEDWYRQDVVKRCLQPGASTAAIALQCGLNANLVRKWVSNARRGDRSGERAEVISWVPVAPRFEAELPRTEAEDRAAGDADVIEIHLGDARIVVGRGVGLERLATVIRALR